MSQHQQVIKHVEKYGYINVLQAIGLYKVMQMARVIHDLKDTDKAMKSIPCPELGKGFVRYVPDFEKRAENATEQYLHNIEHGNLNQRLQAASDLYGQLYYIKATKEVWQLGGFPKSPNVTLEIEQYVA